MSDAVTWNTMLTAAIGGVFSGTLISVVLTLLMQRRTAEIQNEVRTAFERQSTIILSQRRWKETVLSELLGPLCMQLDRTKRAFNRWRTVNLYLEARVVKAGNETIRDLLLVKGHLVAADLRESAGQLVEHYDVWLEEFERVRSSVTPALESKFVFAAQLGRPFPREAEKKFQEAYKTLVRDLESTPSPVGPR